MRGRAGTAALLAGIAFAAAALPAYAAERRDRYSLVHGCYGLKSQAADRFVAKRPGGGYSASAATVAGAEPFRMQATDLGHYLLFGKAGDFLAEGSGGTVEVAASPNDLANWEVDGDSRGFTIVNADSGRALAVSAGADVVLGDPRSKAAVFTFEPAAGCAEFPEAGVNATGEPSKGETTYGEVRGLLDAHLHLMAFEFLGGSARCGRPWHPFGVAHAMVDCPDHGPGGAGAVLENTISYDNPVGTHDTVGWPTFRDWPHHASLTHEGIYWKGLERAWRGGLRLFVNLLVDNSKLCEIYPIKRNPCNEMNTARLQLQRTKELQDYIDAQHGGPGKGWFRVVRDPFEARRVINEGKLAVVIGMETSKLFDCGVYNDVPQCDRAQVDRQLEEFHSRGVRSLEIVNKFDNAFSGVAGDSGNTGVIVNSGNKLETGQFWKMQTCDGKAEDRPQHALPSIGRDQLVANGLQAFLPPGATPVYPEPPHCNTRGLTPLGEHLIRRMIEKGILIDPDHMSVLARKHALSLAEAHDYHGVISSHSWADPEAIPRILRAGGVVTPYAGDSTGFVQEWRETKNMSDGRWYFGFGYGSDMNGFGAQGPPRPGNEKNPVEYPFKSFDGAVTLDRARWGQRVWDVNRDGVSHYGLYPDWIEDLRKVAGQEIVDDMARGAEAYLQTWERALGVPPEECRSARGRFTRRGLARVLIGDTPLRLLRRAGQPLERSGRSWEYCVQGRRNRGARVSAVFTPKGRVALVASTALGHRAARIERGTRASRLGSRARPFGKGVLVRRAGAGRTYVYGVRKGRVRFLAVASRSAARTSARLRAHLRLAGLR